GQHRNFKGLRGLHLVNQQPTFDGAVLVDDCRCYIMNGLVDESEQAQLHRRDEENQPERTAVPKEGQELFAEDGDKGSEHGLLLQAALLWAARSVSVTKTSSREGWMWRTWASENPACRKRAKSCSSDTSSEITACTDWPKMVALGENG